MPAALNETPVLVTGAGGFIGSHLVEALVSAGARVRALVRYESRGGRGWLDALDAKTQAAVEVIAGDVRDGPTVDRATSGIDVIFHLAALIAIPYSFEAPEAYVATNVTGTLNVLEAARRHGTRRVVHASTSEVYGTAQRVPIDEGHPLHPQSPYAATKAAADLLALSYHSTFAAPVTVVRPFNTFGPRQSLRAVVPTIAAQLLAGGPVKLGALAPTRDFIYVSDTVAGFVRAATADAVDGRVVQLGTGREISIKDLVGLIGEVVGVTPRIESDPARLRPATSEVERLVSDPRLAQQLLGWKAKTDLRDGLAKTVAWLRERPPQRVSEYAR